jgi:hypothetical protein
MTVQDISSRSFGSILLVLQPFVQLVYLRLQVRNFELGILKCSKKCQLLQITETATDQDCLDAFPTW